MKEPRNVIGAELQKVRLEKGLSQTELAAICQRQGWDISRNVIAKIEAKTRCVTDFEILLLADALKHSAASFFPRAKAWDALRDHFMKQTHRLSG